MTTRPASLLSWLVIWLGALTAAASAQAVTFAELEGATVGITFVFDQTVLRQGQEFPVRMEQRITLVLGPGDTIHSTAVSTSHNPRGTRHGEPRIASSKLAKPRDVKSLGGGHGVWVFLDGTLTFLRTYKGGGYRQSFAFARNANGVTCTATAAFLRENGTGQIIIDSSVGAGEITIVRARQIGSTCRVTKRS